MSSSTAAKRAELVEEAGSRAQKACAERTEPATFDEFWPGYVRVHRNPINRGLHYVGTTAGLGCVATACATLNPAWLFLAPVVGYGLAWVGHFVFEKNEPATFRHPLWSLRGDFKMYTLALRGRMRDEVERVERLERVRSGANGSATARG
jgi:hypothetical protein